MRAWITKRPAVSFYVFTLALSWSYWLVLLARGERVGAGSAVTHFPGLLGPMLAAMIVTAVIGGRAALYELFGRMFKLGPRRLSNLMLALSPLALGVAGLFAMRVVGKPVPSVHELSQFPGLPSDWPLIAIVAAVLLVDGFGEETGWRGFFTERLLQSHGRARTTLWVGLLWAFWHVPLFWLNAGMSAMAGPVLIGWLFALVCGAFVLAYVYLATGRSILCAALWHTGFNMMVGTEAGTGAAAATVSAAVMIWGVVVAVGWWRRQP